MTIRPRRLRRFLPDAHGVAAVEFALIAPLLIFFYFGMAETVQLMMAQRRVSHAAAAMADLVTQGGQLDSGERNDIIKAGKLILAPFPEDKFRVRITSVVRDPTNTKNVVTWSDAVGTGMAATTRCSTATIKTPINDVGQSVILTEVEFDHQSPIGYALPDMIKLKHAAEMRPRRTNEVIRCERASATADCLPVYPTPCP